MSSSSFTCADLKRALRASGCNPPSRLSVEQILIDFAAIGLVERAGDEWRPTPVGLRLSRELAFGGTDVQQVPATTGVGGLQG